MALEWERPKRPWYLPRPPLTIDPDAARQFDELVDACDRLAREFSGELTATVDYECRFAWLELDCLYVDLVPGGHLETLRRLTAAATSIRILPVTSRLLRIRATLPYFQEP